MRLFIGMKLPKEIRERLQKEWSGVTTAPTNYRPVTPENWHFTIAFLGQVREESRRALEVLLGNAVERPPKGSFLLTDFQTFPAKHPSYMIIRAVAEQKDEWIRFVNRLRDMVSVAAPDVDRKFWIPHITIGRAKNRRLLPQWTHPFTPIKFQPADIALVESQLTQSGARYTDLHVFPLKF